jgi:hypothetical protein
VKNSLFIGGSMGETALCVKEKPKSGCCGGKSPPFGFASDLRVSHERKRCLQWSKKNIGLIPHMLWRLLP